MSTNATSFLWNFGDGNSSTSENPVHTYNNSGVYEITLNTSNEYCGVAVGQTVGVFTNGTTAGAAKGWQVYPNPFGETFTIENGQGNQFSLYNSYGQQVLAGRIIHALQVFTLPDGPAGVYFLQLEQGGQSRWQKIIKL
jgi:PKD repeat protein